MNDSRTSLVTLGLKGVPYQSVKDFQSMFPLDAPLD